MSENQTSGQPVKKRQRRKSRLDKQTKKTDTKMAAAKTSANKGVNKGGCTDAPILGSQSQNSNQGANAQTFSNFPQFPQPSQQNSVPAANYFPGSNFAQPSDYSSKIDYIISKVGKLDAIEAQQSSIISRLSNIETAVSQNKMMIEAASKKIVEIETSQNFLSSNHDSIKKDVEVNKGNVTKVQASLKKLTEENKMLKDSNQKLKTNNDTMQEDIIDLKCRSMRDNMVFVGIPETFHAMGPMGINQRNQPSDTNEGAIGGTAPMDFSQQSGENNAPRSPRSFAQVVSVGEDCIGKIHEFCESVLKITEPTACVKIDRAHRVGNNIPGKQRSIVVKFKDTASKMVVKNALQNINLKNTPFSVFDQFPQIVQERRKELIPVMLEARRNNKKAVLVRDKLYINNKLYRPEAE